MCLEPLVDILALLLPCRRACAECIQTTHIPATIWTPEFTFSFPVRPLPLLAAGRRLLGSRLLGRRRLPRRRSEEHTSELQSRLHLVCRLLLEKKKKKKLVMHPRNHAKLLG